MIGVGGIANGFQVAAVPYPLRLSRTLGGVVVYAVVREWHDDEGWGVIDVPSAPGGCWAGFAAIEMPGSRKLSAGQHVWVTVADGAQEG